MPCETAPEWSLLRGGLTKADETREIAVGRVRFELRDEAGQAMVEYALILTFIALVAFGVLATIGSNVVTILTSVSTGL